MSVPRYSIESCIPYAASPYLPAIYRLHMANPSLQRIEFPDFLEDARPCLGFLAVTTVHELLGAALVNLHEGEATPAYLDTLVVHPDFNVVTTGKGHGIGSALLQTVYAAARSAGKSSMTFEASPAAVPFYLARGCVITSRTSSESRERIFMAASLS